MNAHARRSRANRARILSCATRNIAETAFGRITRPGMMAGTGLRTGTLELHFPSTTHLLATICHAHAQALLEATGCHDPDDPTPPRAALVATAARILACIDANPDAHTILMRDLSCLPAPACADIDHLAEIASFQLDCAWSALRPDLAVPERYTALTRALRTLLLRWPDWREHGPAGHPAAAADRAVAMVEATIDRAPPADAHAPWTLPRPPAPDDRWRPDPDDVMPTRDTTIYAPRRPAAPDAGAENPPIRPSSWDAACPTPRDAPPPPPAHPGLTLREALEKHGLTPTLTAARLGVTRQRLHDLTRGVRTITPNTALRLEALLGEHAETWLARQARYDVHLERARMGTQEAGKARGSAPLLQDGGPRQRASPLETLT